MRISYPEGPSIIWHELEGPIAPCTARGERNDKGDFVLFDFWTDGPMQGKGFGRKLLTELRAKYKWIILRAIGTETREGTKKAESFWQHMFDVGLVDELHYLRKKKPIIRERPCQTTRSPKK